MNLEDREYQVRFRGAALLGFMILIAILGNFHLFAQAASSLSGVWSGNLEVENGFMLWIELDGVSKGKLYEKEIGSVDSPKVYLLDRIVIDKSLLEFAAPSLGAFFSGKISVDGKVIHGTWTEGEVSTPIVFEHREQDDGLKVDARKKMEKNAHPRFEVATIKLASPDEPNQGFMTEGRTIQCKDERVRDILSFAFGVHPSTVIGKSEWIESRRFNISGYADVEGDPNMEQMKEMFRELLKSRFGLKYHREARPLDVYALELNKTPLRITKSLGDPDASPDQSITNWTHDSISLKETNATMKEFSSMLDLLVSDRPTIDHTGLPDRYDFVITWNPNDIVTEPTAISRLPSLSGALAGIGLKLRARKELYEVIVIDYVGQPSEN